MSNAGGDGTSAQPQAIRPTFVGRWEEHARKFLLLVAAVTTPVFTLPIFLDPVGWARAFGWEIPDDTDLVVYFGRGAGCFLLLAEVLWWQGALTGRRLRVAYDLLVALVALMVVLHVWGELAEAQPVSETLEIGMYGALVALALLFYPRGAAD